ncbi:30S ribosomal protein S4 [Oligella ureolytica]
MLISAGDVISVREKSQKQLRIKESMELAAGIGLPQWIEMDSAKFSGTFKQAPERTDVAQDIDESLVVELYSR